MKRTTTLLLALALSIPLPLAMGGCGDKEEKKPASKAGENDSAKGKDGKSKKPARPKTTKMVAKMEPKNGSSVGGDVWFETGKNSMITIQITGLTPGLHGLQIAEKGDCSSDDGLSAGEPYNPTNSVHGKTDSPRFQVGDLGNIAANATGKAEKILNSTLVKVKGEHSVAGRAVIVYAGPHDLRTHPRGNAGDIIGCGVIKPLK